MRREVVWGSDLNETYAENFLDGMVGRRLPLRLDGAVRADAVLVSYQVIDQGEHVRLIVDLPD